jgi:hypothetical protein
MAVFGQKSYLPASLIDPILKNIACCSILINSFQAIAPLTGQKKGVFFLRGNISLKMGRFAPLLATIQPFSEARAFLLG